MLSTILISLAVVLLCVAYAVYSPHLDRTRTGTLLLWYTSPISRERKSVKL